jgi:hypothetical protein
VNNAALNVNGMISTGLLGIWDVGKEALEQVETVGADDLLYACNHTNFEALNEAQEGTCAKAPDLDGMFRLTVLTSFLQFSGILFVWLLPNTRDELVKMNYDKKSKLGGGIFLFVTLSSLLYSIVAAVLNIMAPGWMGES